MMRPVLDDLDPDVRKLLDDAAPGIEPPVDAKQRISARLVQTVALLPDSWPTADHPADLPASSVAARFIARAAHWPWTPIATALVAGTMAGAGGYALLQTPAKERIANLDRSGGLSPSNASGPFEAPSSPAPMSAQSEEPRQEMPVGKQPSETPPPFASRGEPKRPLAAAAPSDLDAEQHLLDSARRALAEGRNAEAFEPIGEHERRFPKGVLVEEREALLINALVGSSRYAEARDRANAFLRHYPNSLLRLSVEAAIVVIP
jgi:hypothetical protein